MDENLTPWLDNIRGEQVLPLIESDSRYIRVEAGPGTGKTFGLIRRVQRVLHPNGLGVPGDQVLVVAFNRVIAQQLEMEIGERLEESGFDGTGPVIKTIHALCMSVSQVDRLLMPHEVDAMLYDVAESNPRLYQRYRRHDKIHQALRDHEANHTSDPELWAECRRWLERHHASLISELPGLLLARLQLGDLPDYRYSHIIVDEFQDLTSGEQQLMVRLLRDGGSLTALGDPRQSIYHFRGNDLEGLSKLEEITGSSVQDIRITECQRCPAPIVIASNTLMADHPATPMVSISTATANNHVVHWNTTTKEIEGMARAIHQNILAHPEDKHLVMVTRRPYGYKLRNELALLNPDLEVNISFSESALDMWPAREAFLSFCLIAAPDAPTWRAWFAYQAPNQEGTFKSAKRNAPAYLDLLATTNDDISSATIDSIIDGTLTVRGGGSGHIRERALRFQTIKDSYAGQVPRALIENIFKLENWDLTGCGELETARINLEQLRVSALEALDDIESSDEELTNEEKITKITKILRGQIAMKEPLATTSGPKVQIATLWSAKGVTANHVYVLGLNAEMIPGTRRDDYPGTDAEYYDEQKRLFYVTITRSKKTLVLSRSHKMKRQDARTMGITVQHPESLWPELAVSPFLTQIIDQLPDGVPGETWGGC